MDDKIEAAIQRWIIQIEQACMGTDSPYVNIIVDQAGYIPSLISDLKRFQPEISWCSLLENEPENVYIDDAPIFLQIQTDIWQQKEWLSALLRQYHEPSRVLLFFSLYDFKQLAQYLQRLIIAEWEGRKGVMRFYDTRMFPLLMNSILTEQQQHYFLDAAQLWSWRDRDGKSVWLPGQFQRAVELNSDALLTLDDKQYDRLGYISDIECFSDVHLCHYPEFSREELFQHLWTSVDSMAENNVVDNEAFFIKYLSMTEK